MIPERYRPRTTNILIYPQLKTLVMKFSKWTVVMLTAVVISGSAAAQGATAREKSVTVGGAPMYTSKNIIENAINSADHTTLVAAVKAAGLVATLQGPGPFTVFAPTNAAFDQLPEGTVASLLQPENKTQLTKVLTYHVVAGKLSAADLATLVRKGNGKAELSTVSGGKLSVMMQGKDIVLKDEQGRKAKVTIADVNQSNGVIHVIDEVVLPR